MIEVGKQYRFVPRRNEEYRCRNCNAVVWGESAEAYFNSVVTVTGEADSYRDFANCGNRVTGLEGFWEITHPDWWIPVAAPYTWLEPLD